MTNDHGQTTMTLHGKHLIGRTTSREGEASFNGVDPRDGRVLEPSYVDATSAEIDRALGLATDAFARLRRIDRVRRAAFLDAIADRIVALGDPLLERASEETALPIARLTAERGRTANQLKMFAELIREGSWVDARIDHGDPTRTPAPKPDVRRMLRPIGPVVVFGASNFPLAFSVAGGDTASAFAAGCPVVVKAHPHHPGTSEMVGRAIIEAAEETGMPVGTFSLLHGKGIEVGRGLVIHSMTKAVGFTGSLAGGRALFDAAGSRQDPIPVYAEMGSTNPSFMMPGALAERGAEIATGLLQSFTMGVGQFCTNPGVVVALDDQATAKFIGSLSTLLEQATEGTMLHEGIRRAFDAGIDRLSSIAGVETHRKESASRGPCAASPAFMTVRAETFLANPSIGEEVFGPSTAVVLCASTDEMMAVARSLAGQLTATIHGSDADLVSAGDLLSILEEKAGRVLVNGFPTGVEVSHAMQHGGPWPATSDSRSTSVGSAAITRFARPVAWQDVPETLLPEELKEANPLRIVRMVDGSIGR